MSITLNGDTGITTPMYNGTISANAVTPSVSMKNRIINGAMVIDQRWSGAQVIPADGSYSIDRWKCGQSVANKYKFQQNAGSVTTPVGFNNYLGITSLTSYSISSTDIFNIYQPIEGFNTADLMWGTANAKTVTLSFWVQSSLTGTFGGAINNNALNRSYPFQYTISNANTWTQISITIAGDTAGTWVGATNGTGLIVAFGLGIGSTYSGTAGAWAGTYYGSATGATSVVGTNGATFYITGVQLEVGSSATSFDYRNIATELQLCQRYYQYLGGDQGTYTFLGTGNWWNSTDGYFGGYMAVTMRTAPTFAYTGTLSYFKFQSNASGDTTPTGLQVDNARVSSYQLNVKYNSQTAGQAIRFFNSSVGGALTFSAEL